MKIYTKVINGVSVFKPINKIILIENGYQIINPTVSMVEKNGWEEFIEEISTPIEKSELEKKKKDLIEKTNDYYKSENVKCFLLRGEKVWLDDSDRAKLKFRFESELRQGNVTKTVLWFNGKCFDLTLDYAIEMLYNIEFYASKCYDTLQKHLSEIEDIQDINLLNTYNYTFGYPEIIIF